MRVIELMPKESKGVQKLHIETHGCVINVTVNLTNMAGKKVTSVEILPDRYMGEEWHLAEEAPVNIRVVEGKAEDEQNDNRV
jgi:hypothetical protein